MPGEIMGNQSNVPEGDNERNLSLMEKKGVEDAIKILESLRTYGKDSADLYDLESERAYLRTFAETLLTEVRREIEIEEEE